MEYSLEKKEAGKSPQPSSSGRHQIWWCLSWSRPGPG